MNTSTRKPKTRSKSTQNRIEGAWKHAKDHFRRMSGTKISQFEGHLGEIMWRSEAKNNIFYLMKSVCTLDGPADYLCGIADSSQSNIHDWEIKPGNSCFFCHIKLCLSCNDMHPVKLCLYSNIFLLTGNTDAESESES
jgi:hypothetical protein